MGGEGIVWKRRGGTGDGWRGGEGRYRGEEWVKRGEKKGGERGDKAGKGERVRRGKKVGVDEGE